MILDLEKRIEGPGGLGQAEAAAREAMGPGQTENLIRIVRLLSLSSNNFAFVVCCKLISRFRCNGRRCNPMRLGLVIAW